MNTLTELNTAGVDSPSQQINPGLPHTSPGGCCYRLDIQYDGSLFYGWQKQAGLPTVEQALLDAYRTWLGEEVWLDASGRTDHGVHARHQVVVLHLPRQLPPRAVLQGPLPALTPGIRLFHASAVDHTWRPRPVISREYRYFLWQAHQAPLFLARYCTPIATPLNLAKMQQAAELIPGERDFSAFRAAGCTARHAIRRIESVRVHQTGPLIEVRVKGNAFLRQMVRILVGTLVDVGRGALDAGEITGILAARDRTRAGSTVPPGGLFLWEITTQPDPPQVIPPTPWEQPT